MDPRFKGLRHQDQSVKDRVLELLKDLEIKRRLEQPQQQAAATPAVAPAAALAAAGNFDFLAEIEDQVAQADAAVIVPEELWMMLQMQS